MHSKTEISKADKENMNPNKPTRQKLMAEPDPGGISLQDCKELLACHKDSPFDLDAFVHLPEGFFKGSTGGGIRIHTRANGVRDELAKASEYNWK